MELSYVYVAASITVCGMGHVGLMRPIGWVLSLLFGRRALVLATTLVAVRASVICALMRVMGIAEATRKMPSWEWGRSWRMSGRLLSQEAVTRSVWALKPKAG